jgi:hypothetical protein
MPRRLAARADSSAASGSIDVRAAWLIARPYASHGGRLRASPHADRDVLVILPTYNERENLDRLCDGIRAHAPGADV